jgi:hypothetical protein
LQYEDICKVCRQVLPELDGSPSTTQQIKPPLSLKKINFDHEIMEIALFSQIVIEKKPPFHQSWAETCVRITVRIFVPLPRTYIHTLVFEVSDHSPVPSLAQTWLTESCSSLT